VRLKGLLIPVEIIQDFYLMLLLVILGAYPEIVLLRKYVWKVFIVSDLIVMLSPYDQLPIAATVSVPIGSISKKLFTAVSQVPVGPAENVT